MKQDLGSIQAILARLSHFLHSTALQVQLDQDEANSTIEKQEKLLRLLSPKEIVEEVVDERNVKEMQERQDMEKLEAILEKARMMRIAETKPKAETKDISSLNLTTSHTQKSKGPSLDAKQSSKYALPTPLTKKELKYELSPYLLKSLPTKFQTTYKEWLKARIELIRLEEDTLNSENEFLKELAQKMGTENEIDLLLEEFPGLYQQGLNLLKMTSCHYSLSTGGENSLLCYKQSWENWKERASFYSSSAFDHKESAVSRCPSLLRMKPIYYSNLQELFEIIEIQQQNMIFDIANHLLQILEMITQELLITLNPTSKEAKDWCELVETIQNQLDLLVGWDKPRQSKGSI